MPYLMSLLSNKVIFDKKAQMSKVKVAYSYKGDITILQQEIDESIKKALHELDL